MYSNNILTPSINYLDIQTKEHPSQLNFLVMNEEGYINLLYLSSISHTSGNNPIGIYHKDLKKYTNGLICYIGGEYNPLLILKHQNQIEEISVFIKTHGIQISARAGSRGMFGCLFIKISMDS